MTYIGGIDANNTGNNARKVATADRRADCASRFVERGRIGRTSDTASSSAKIEPISRRNRSPRFLESVRRWACRPILISTIAALGGGSSSASAGSGESFTVHLGVGGSYPTPNEYGCPAHISYTTQRQRVASSEAR